MAVYHYCTQRQLSTGAISYTDGTITSNGFVGADDFADICKKLGERIGALPGEFSIISLTLVSDPNERQESQTPPPSGA